MKQICLSPFLPKLATNAYTLVVLLKRHVSMSIYVRHPTELASWAANESQGEQRDRIEDIGSRTDSTGLISVWRAPQQRIRSRQEFRQRMANLLPWFRCQRVTVLGMSFPYRSASCDQSKQSASSDPQPLTSLRLDYAQYHASSLFFPVSNYYDRNL